MAGKVIVRYYGSGPTDNLRGKVASSTFSPTPEASATTPPRYIRQRLYATREVALRAIDQMARLYGWIGVIVSECADEDDGPPLRGTPPNNPFPPGMKGE